MKPSFCHENTKWQEKRAVSDRPLCRCVQHVFNEDAISGGRIVNEDMSNGADQFSVLYDGTAGHADVK